MKKDTRTLQLLFLLCALVCVACSGGSIHAVLPKPRPTQTQGVTAQYILSNPVTYVALGASDAVGIGTSNPSVQGYIPLLAAHLRKGSRTINLGISGIRLHDALLQELPLAFNTNPSLITIWLVTND